MYVILDDDEPSIKRDESRGEPYAQSERVKDLWEQVVYLREQLDREREARTEERRRHDTIIAQLSAATAEQARTIWAIEAPASEEAAEAAERLVWMEGRWADVAAKVMAARLAGILMTLVEEEGVVTPEGPMIPARYTHAQFASMIGANREATTRAFRELREIGAVETRRRRVHVTDPEALRRAAG